MAMLSKLKQLNGSRNSRFSAFALFIFLFTSGDVQSSVRYDLALDPGRLISRAVFDETKNWTLSRRKTLGLGDHCEEIKLLLPVRILGLGKGREGFGGRGRVKKGLGKGKEPRLACQVSGLYCVKWAERGH